MNKSSIGIVGVDGGDIILRPGQTGNFTVQAVVDGSYTAADIYEIYRLDNIGARVAATPTKFSNGELVLKYCAQFLLVEWLDDHESTRFCYDNLTCMMCRISLS